VRRSDTFLQKGKVYRLLFSFKNGKVYQAKRKNSYKYSHAKKEQPIFISGLIFWTAIKGACCACGGVTGGKRRNWLARRWSLLRGELLLSQI